jgi:hypothetical protein
MSLLKIVLVVVLALVLEKPTTRTRTIFAFSHAATEGLSIPLVEWELGHNLACWPEGPGKV